VLKGLSREFGNEGSSDVTAAAEYQKSFYHVSWQETSRLVAMSTRMLIFLSLLCGIAILVAFAVQVTLS
jgi:hypothetical protein